jgi:hypothetical protein
MKQYYHSFSRNVWFVVLYVCACVRACDCLHVTCQDTRNYFMRRNRKCSSLWPSFAFLRLSFDAESLGSCTVKERLARLFMNMITLRQVTGLGWCLPSLSLRFELIAVISVPHTCSFSVLVNPCSFCFREPLALICPKNFGDVQLEFLCFLTVLRSSWQRLEEI